MKDRLYTDISLSNQPNQEQELKAWSSFEQTGSISDYLAYRCAMPNYAQNDREEASDNADHNKRHRYTGENSWQ